MSAPDVCRSSVMRAPRWPISAPASAAGIWITRNHGELTFTSIGTRPFGDHDVRPTDEFAKVGAIGGAVTGTPAAVAAAAATAAVAPHPGSTVRLEALLFNGGLQSNVLLRGGHGT
eukprot:NODE_21915_length_730_cov_3.908789.p3 GENE.NODE_21915_length_730_cov_3.908789~~NODE_21915_length_730_cov_3.908789.p3  ORF type:complete len:116 (-),score=35.32 NODE_21915_length_730_cov_3.908789:23-370(-)